jgi:phospholipase C
VHPYNEFARDLSSGNYGVSYTFIEPSYNVLADYKCSTSQHPLDDVTRGEALIRATYSAIRNSPVWERSMLVISWDEHGGFFDHAVPPSAVPPGDSHAGSDHNQFGFTFDRYGVRVPAVVVSPWIPRNLVDHRLYDHTSILSTVENMFGVPPLSKRDQSANPLTTLLSLTAARTDAPLELPPPAVSNVPGCPAVDFVSPLAPALSLLHVACPEGSVNDGNVAGVLHAALRGDLALSPPDLRSKVLAQFSAVKTRADAMKYAACVRDKVLAAQGQLPPSADTATSGSSSQ